MRLVHGNGQSGCPFLEACLCFSFECDLSGVSAGYSPQWPRRPTVSDQDVSSEMIACWSQTVWKTTHAYRVSGVKALEAVPVAI